jgi:glycosyltransferase involved in cell wall biosynthesis
MTPLVSISCLAYNHKPYIRDAMEGFLMQKTNFPYEIVVHDDASTDGTTQIIKEYEDKYPELIFPIYQSENQYSKGIHSISATFIYPKTRGKYIALCEGDDYWIDPRKLQQQIDFLESNPEYTLCFHNAIKLWENKSKNPKYFCPKNLKEDLGMEDLLSGWLVPTQSMVFRTDIFNTIPSWSNQIFNGDYLYQLWCAHHGKVRFIDKVMSVYRQNVSGVSSVASKGNLNHLLDKILFLLDSFNEETGHGYNEAVEKRKKGLINFYKNENRKRKAGILYHIFHPTATISYLIKAVKDY